MEDIRMSFEDLDGNAEHQPLHGNSEDDHICEIEMAKEAWSEMMDMAPETFSLLVPSVVLPRARSTVSRYAPWTDGYIGSFEAHRSDDDARPRDMSWDLDDWVSTNGPMPRFLPVDGVYRVGKSHVRGDRWPREGINAVQLMRLSPALAWWRLSLSRQEQQHPLGGRYGLPQSEAEAPWKKAKIQGQSDSTTRMFGMIGKTMSKFFKAITDEKREENQDEGSDTPAPPPLRGPTPTIRAPPPLYTPPRKLRQYGTRQHLDIIQQGDIPTLDSSSALPPLLLVPQPPSLPSPRLPPLLSQPPPAAPLPPLSSPLPLPSPSLFSSLSSSPYSSSSSSSSSLSLLSILSLSSLPSPSLFSSPSISPSPTPSSSPILYSSPAPAPAPPSLPPPCLSPPPYMPPSQRLKPTTFRPQSRVHVLPMARIAASALPVLIRPRRPQLKSYNPSLMNLMKASTPNTVNKMARVFEEYRREPKNRPQPRSNLVQLRNWLSEPVHPLAFRSLLRWTGEPTRRGGDRMVNMLYSYGYRAPLFKPTEIGGRPTPAVPFIGLYWTTRVWASFEEEVEQFIFDNGIPDGDRGFLGEMVPLFDEMLLDEMLLDDM